MKPRLFSPGFWCTAALTLAGVWLMLAPSLVGASTAGGGWDAARSNDVATGAVLAAAGFMGMFAQLAFGLRDAAWDATAEAAEAAEAASPEHAPQAGAG